MRTVLMLHLLLFYELKPKFIYHFIGGFFSQSNHAKESRPRQGIRPRLISWLAGQLTLLGQAAVHNTWTAAGTVIHFAFDDMLLG